MTVSSLDPLWGHSSRTAVLCLAVFLGPGHGKFLNCPIKFTFHLLENVSSFGGLSGRRKWRRTKEIKRLYRMSTARMLCPGNAFCHNRDLSFDRVSKQKQLQGLCYWNSAVVEPAEVRFGLGSCCDSVHSQASTLLPFGFVFTPVLVITSWLRFLDMFLDYRHRSHGVWHELWALRGVTSLDVCIPGFLAKVIWIIRMSGPAKDPQPPTKHSLRHGYGMLWLVYYRNLGLRFEATIWVAKRNWVLFIILNFPLSFLFILACDFTWLQGMLFLYMDLLCNGQIGTIT